MFNDDDSLLFVDESDEEEEELLELDDSLEPKPKALELTEHDRFLLEQTHQFKERQNSRRKVEAAMALILCSTLTGNVALLFVQWGAGWLLAATLSTSIGLASVGFIPVGEGNKLISKAKYLVPVGASFFATNDYRDKQFQAWLGIESYKTDVATYNYGDEVQVQPEGVLNIVVIIAAIFAIVFGFSSALKKSEHDIDNIDF